MLKKIGLFWSGMVCGWITIMLFIIVWIFFIPHSSHKNFLNSEVIVLDNNEKLLFTFDNGCSNSLEPDTPIFTHLKNNNQWSSNVIPEGTVTKDDEYILTSSADKSIIYLLLPRKIEGFFWDLTKDAFQHIHGIDSLETGEHYIHQLP